MKRNIALAAAALAAALFASTPQPAKAEPTIALFLAIPIASVLVNDGIMLVCQHRLLHLEEVGPSLIPIFSQEQLFKSGVCARRAPAR